MQAKQAQRRPLVFIPGLFGSMSDRIVPGTGDWSFGLAGIFYTPFVQELESMGYQKNKTLFIAYYDWRQPISLSAHTYLVHTIREARQKTGASKVNLICHSLGGLVARAYVQSESYQNDVEQMIILCTPNAGSPANAVYWTGGTIEPHPGTPINAVALYMHTYLDYLGSLSPLDPLAAIHTHFPSLAEVVPGEAYGDYLVMPVDDAMRLVPYEMMQVKNPFLDELNAQQSLIHKRNIEVTLIAGINQSTTQYLQEVYVPMGGTYRRSNVWRSINSCAGDGNAMVNSVFVLKGDSYLVDGDHMEVLFRSYPLLKKKLT